MKRFFAGQVLQYTGFGNTFGAVPGMNPPPYTPKQLEAELTAAWKTLPAQWSIAGWMESDDQIIGMIMDAVIKLAQQTGVWSATHYENPSAEWVAWVEQNKTVVA